MFSKFTTAGCVCVFSSHSFWTSSSLDVPAGVTARGGGGGALPDFFFFFFSLFSRPRAGVRCQTFSFSFFPCSADHERDWPPPCKVVFFGLATNALNVRNNKQQHRRKVTHCYIPSSVAVHYLKTELTYLSSQSPAVSIHHSTIIARVISLLLGLYYRVT